MRARSRGVNFPSCARNDDFMDEPCLIQRPLHGRWEGRRSGRRAQLSRSCPTLQQASRRCPQTSWMVGTKPSASSYASGNVALSISAMRSVGVTPNPTPEHRTTPAVFASVSERWPPSRTSISQGYVEIVNLDGQACPHQHIRGLGKRPGTKRDRYLQGPPRHRAVRRERATLGGRLEFLANSAILAASLLARTGTAPRIQCMIASSFKCIRNYTSPHTGGTVSANHAVRVQYNALPYRFTKSSTPEILLVTSRETRMKAGLAIRSCAFSRR